MNEDQYHLVSGRRQAFDNSMWQTPALATGVQAFLLAASFDKDATKDISIILAVFSAIVGLASIQLLAKHRHGETEDSRLLEEFEKKHAEKGYSVLHGRQRRKFVTPNTFTGVSSFRVWVSVLCGFVALALYAVYKVL